MRKKTITSFLAILSLCTISCTKGGSPADSTLSLTLESELVSSRSDEIFAHVEAASDWTLALSDSTGEAPAWASLSKTSGSGNANSVLKYTQNDARNKRSLTVSLSSGSAKVEKNFTQKGNGDEPEKPQGIPAWMELPEQNSSLPFHSHSFECDAATYRNYSLGWDAKNRLASWVAYPLNSFYSAKKVKRSDDVLPDEAVWVYDPDISEGEQAYLLKSYSGYFDRGHQLPSADRLVCREANLQTFYFSNMTPQWDQFNQGIWGIIESNVRAWGEKSDTLYVLTGCVMEGSTTSTTDRLGNNCPVPAAYFKAVLRYSKASTIGWGGYCGMGYYLKHTRTQDQTITKDMVMSLGNLEKKLGYTLFVNLGAAVGEETAARIKAQDPATVSFWGL